MPRPPAIPHVTLKTIIKNAQVVDETGNVVGPSHNVWTALSTELDNKLTANYIYVFVKDNRHGILDEIYKEMGIQRKLVENVNEEDEDECKSEEETSDGKKGVLLPSATFSILIPPEKWKEMEPVEVVVQRRDRPGNRRKLVLPRYKWEPIIIDCLWDQQKLPCPYTFINSTVYTSDTREYFIKMQASCTECGAIACGTILSEPLDCEAVPLQWRANDTRSVPHSKKRHLSHDLRQELGRVLQGRSATAFRKSQAAEKMDHGDLEPPNLFSSAALRRCQQQGMNEEYSFIEECSDPIQNLQTLKHTHPCAGSIHQIGMDPFFVFYHAAEQLRVFKNFNAGNYVVLSIDATGSLVTKVTTHNEKKSGHIFLYEGVIKANGEQLPVLQMLSARQDASIIQFWLKEYLRQGGPIPDEAVVDGSKALINGIVATLCGCYHLRDYYSRCFCILVEPDVTLQDIKTLLPCCFLRLDMAHIIGNAAKWKEWKIKSLKRLKLFFMMCLGQLILETSLQGFRDTFIKVCHVAGSEFLSPEVTDTTNLLVQRIQGTNALMEPLLQNDEENAECVDDDFEPFDPLYDPDQYPAVDNLSQFLKDIQKEIECKCKEVTSEDFNPYYAPHVVTYLNNLLPDFLLWTGVMVSTFHSPTITGSSARVESDFNNLKNNILCGKKRRLRVDKFVAIHLKHIKGACHLASSEKPVKSTINNNVSDGPTSNHLIHSTPQRTDSGDSDNELQKSLNTSENWRGLAPTPKKSKTSKYLNPCPELAVAMESNSLQPPKLRLLENGLKKGFLRTSGNSHAQVTNTCGFDVLIQVITSAFIQYESYRMSLDPYLQHDVIKVCQSLAVKGAVPETYMLRLYVLSKVTQPTKVVGPPKSVLRKRKSSVAITYDCFCDLVDTSRKLLEKIISANITFKCSLRKFRSCTSPADYVVINADMEVLQQEGMKKLDKAILTALSVMDRKSEELPATNPLPSACPVPCPGSGMISVEFGPHLIVNVDIYGSTTEHQAMVQSVKIEDVPVNLNLLGQKFVLCGIGAREPNHFVAYTRRASGSWELFNDLSKNVSGAKLNKRVQPVLLMYIPFNV